MNNIPIQDFISQDGGIVKTIFANTMALANLTISDSTASPELKEIAEQLKMQTEVFYKAHNEQRLKITTAGTASKIKKPQN